MSLSGEDWIPPRLVRLDELLRHSAYRGWDPFDLSNSPLLARIPNGWWLPQLVLSKAGSRLVTDRGRRLLRVPRIEDPKIYACAYFGYRFGGLADFRRRAEEMIDRLAALATPQPGGRRAWGYDYVWATRGSGVNPRGASTIVPGAFAALTLMHHTVDSGERRHLELMEEALEHYAINHASRTGSGVFLSYFQHGTTNTHNANLLGCAALTLGAEVLGRQDWLELAAEAATTTVLSVDDRGYLPYAKQRSGDWIDCFHHLYVIACVRAVARANPHVDARLFEDTVARMWAFARSRFIRDDGLVNYYPDKLYPIDPHNFAAVAIFSVMSDQSMGLPAGYGADLLRRVDALTWDADRGAYAYKRHARHTDRRLFLRWTQAWMFAALAVVSAAEQFQNHVAVTARLPG